LFVRTVDLFADDGITIPVPVLLEGEESVVEFIDLPYSGVSPKSVPYVAVRKPKRLRCHEAITHNYRVWNDISPTTVNKSSFQFSKKTIKKTLTVFVLLAEPPTASTVRDVKTVISVNLITKLKPNNQGRIYS